MKTYKFRVDAFLNRCYSYSKDTRKYLKSLDSTIVRFMDHEEFHEDLKQYVTDNPDELESIDKLLAYLHRGE